MAATKTINDTIAWAQTFINWASLTIGTGKEPAMSSANLALQTILGPPFVWPWNRNTKTFLTTQGVQDYNASMTDFGFLETASIQASANITSASLTSGVITYIAANNFSTIVAQPGTVLVTVGGCINSAFNITRQPILAATPTQFTVASTLPNAPSENESGALALAGPIMPLEIKWGSVSEATEQDRPSFISVQNSNESGVSTTFRILPVPDGTYQVNLNYQIAPQVITDTGWTWGIPDQFQYIYSYFFLFLVMDYFDDPRATRYRQLAISSLLSRQSGLSDTDKNLFIGNWLPLVQQEEGASMDKQQGTQARGL